MVFSAAAESFQNPGSAVFSSRADIRTPRESNPPPDVVDFGLYFPYRGIQFGK